MDQTALECPTADAPKPPAKKHRKRRWFRRSMPKGLAPGAFQVDPCARPTQIDVFAFDDGKLLEKKQVAAGELRGIVDSHRVTWINVEGLGDRDVIQRLGQLFDLHPLALEDVVNTHQRAKVDNYENVVYVVARMLQGPPLVGEQISFFVGPNFVLTFQEDLAGDAFNPVRDRLRAPRSRVRQLGSDYLFYELLDAVIDGYFPLIEACGQRLDELEDEVPVSRSNRRLLADIHRQRMDLLELRRTIWPIREAVQHLLRTELPFVSKETVLYLRDGYDHTVQMLDILEIYRETCGDLREYYYSVVNSRTNEIMRVLTIIATIFMPLSFVASVYGMNFENMPELKSAWGYPAALTAMALIAGSFLMFFWRKGWLRSNDLTAPPGDGRD